MRISEILIELRKIIADLKVTIQSGMYPYQLEESLGTFDFIKIESPEQWAKSKDGSPDIDRIRNYYSKYSDLSNNFIKQTLKDRHSYDFMLSDYVVDAFQVGNILGVPVFGVAHFTWEWFFSKMYPRPISEEALINWRRREDLADQLYFPLFTPAEILLNRENSTSTGLIVKQQSLPTKKIAFSDRRSVLLVDSGSNLLSAQLIEALNSVEYISNLSIYCREKLILDYKKYLIALPNDDLLIKHIPNMDFVIARAGFNTICECLLYKKPMLLFSEFFNPEMKENIDFMRNLGLAAYISIENLRDDLKACIEKFCLKDLNRLKENYNNLDLHFNGAATIARDIAIRLSRL